MSSSQPAPHKWAVFAAVGSSYFITVVSTTLAILALPAIADDFEVTLRTVGWVVIAESLIIAALLLPLGGLSDLLGKHRALRVGVAVFGIGLVLTGFAPTFALLIVARVVTAFGNTLIQSVGTGILVAAFPPEERGLALGGQTTAVAMGAATGPLLGGLLLDELEWNVLFFAMAIPTAISFAIIHWALGSEPDSAPGDADGFDTNGAALSAAFIVVLVFTLTDPFEFGLASAPTIAGVVLAIGLLVAFVRAELAHHAPMLDMRLFRIGEFRKAVAIRGIAFVASTTILFLIPIYLLGVRDLSTRATGGLIALFAVGMTLGAQISGRLYDRVGARIPMAVGLLCQIGVLAMLSRIGQESAIVLIGVASVGNGFGQGLWNVPANSMLMGAMPASSFGVGGAFTNVTRTVGSVVGQAGATALVAGIMTSQGFDIPLGDIGESVGAKAAFVDGWQTTFAVGAVVTTVALAVALRAESRARVRNDAPARS